MAKFQYWMVFLPEVDADSFLLFVHDQSGSTKLRSYAAGCVQVISQPKREYVARNTQGGHTRHECAPHTVTDFNYWRQKTLECNRRYLERRSDAQATPQKESASGRASRGSQLQLQDYVNQSPGKLAAAVLDQLPPRLRELGASIRWVSPLLRDGYREYRDADFLAQVGLGEHARTLADFWPGSGPRWDALGIVSCPNGGLKPGVILVEAKSHIKEVIGNGCKASPESLRKIETSLTAARAWCGAESSGGWLGPLYQSANRIAHLYFLRSIVQTPAWLVNLYFTGDPIDPTDQADWEAEVSRVKGELGLVNPVQGMVEVYLPALTDHPKKPAGQMPPPSGDGFQQWATDWMELGEFTGDLLPDPGQRIATLLSRWSQPVPGTWHRDVDQQLLSARYRRGDAGQPHPGEHELEHQVLTNLESVQCLGGTLLDGINAMPLTRDASGGRLGNIEADLFLLMQRAGTFHLLLCEVKTSDRTPWYAAIENLRQLRLCQLGVAARRLFHLRAPHLQLPENIPVTGLVLAPEQYYRQPGKKGRTLPHTKSLLRQFTANTGIGTHLAVWDPGQKTIALLE